MQFIRPMLGLAISLVLAAGVSAEDQVEHKEHHPESAGATAKAVPKPAAPRVKESAKKMDDQKEAMKKMDDQIRMMRDMHEKMMSAKSPEERSAMMAEHMKMMQGCMAMMGNMRTDANAAMKGEMSEDMRMHRMMEKRMEMMESMMQMMLDRMPAPAAK